MENLASIHDMSNVKRTDLKTDTECKNLEPCDNVPELNDNQASAIISEPTSNAVKGTEVDDELAKLSLENEIIWKILNVDRRKVEPNDGSLPKELFLEAEYDLHEKQEWIERDVEALKDLVEAEPGLRSRMDRAFLLSFLRARKFDYEKAMNMVSYNLYFLNTFLSLLLC